MWPEGRLLLPPPLPPPRLLYEAQNGRLVRAAAQRRMRLEEGGGLRGGCSGSVPALHPAATAASTTIATADMVRLVEARVVKGRGDPQSSGAGSLDVGSLVCQLWNDGGDGGQGRRRETCAIYRCGGRMWLLLWARGGGSSAGACRARGRLPVPCLAGCQSSRALPR